MNKFILLISTLLLISCKTETDAESSAEDLADTTAFQQKLKIEDPNYALDAEARKYALNWVEYITAQNEVQKLEGATVNEVMNNAGAIAQIMESLKKSVPDSLKSVAVEARLNVVDTKARLLKQYSGKQEPDAEDIAQTTRELHQEFNNLKLQMNEIFLKSLEDFEKELDEFEENERKQDSIRPEKSE
ncbi:hypothetical protein GCM10023115_36520 [Pontixanthobacter gangjinensis]|uniref:Uncharacterized protein n=1 Tax=Christiangramia aestuarii TaxID=1028746 RepID=A0A7K1LRE1_9FLAO|nr:hypothetical protein [Christiangramia aestuarii]MUP43181.1 hypothetical protein [Christiangramia aestuarii]